MCLYFFTHDLHQTINRHTASFSLPLLFYSILNVGLKYRYCIIWYSLIWLHCYKFYCIVCSIKKYAYIDEMDVENNTKTVYIIHCKCQFETRPLSVRTGYRNVFCIVDIATNNDFELQPSSLEGVLTVYSILSLKHNIM